MYPLRLRGWYCRHGAIGQNTDGECVNGLCACGDAADSFYGHEYPLRLPDGSIGRCFVFVSRFNRRRYASRLAS